MKTYDLSLISKNRSTIYGLTILYIMFYHASVQFNFTYLLPLSLFKIAGQMGVDIFLFVSGISLYFSAVKGGSIGGFYRRRLERVLLPALLVGIPYFFITDILRKKAGAGAFFADLTGLSLFLNGSRTTWFVTAIILFYLLYPLIYRALKASGWSTLTLTGLIAAAVVIFFAMSRLWPVFWKRSSILFERLVVFIFGAWTGKFVCEKKTLQIKRRTVLITAALFLAFFAVYLAVRFVFKRGQIVSERYIYGFIALFVTAGFSLLGEVKPVSRIASRLAPYTLEIYLVHEKTLEWLESLTNRPNDFIVNLAAAALAIVFAAALRFVENRILDLVHRPKRTE